MALCCDPATRPSMSRWCECPRYFVHCGRPLFFQRLSFVFVKFKLCCGGGRRDRLLSIRQSIASLTFCVTTDQSKETASGEPYGSVCLKLKNPKKWKSSSSRSVAIDHFPRRVRSVSSLDFQLNVMPYDTRDRIGMSTFTWEQYFMISLLRSTHFDFDRCSVVRALFFLRLLPEHKRTDSIGCIIEGRRVISSCLCCSYYRLRYPADAVTWPPCSRFSFSCFSVRNPVLMLQRSDTLIGGGIQFLPSTDLEGETREGVSGTGSIHSRVLLRQCRTDV